MTANEWLEVMKQATDFPIGMEKCILRYGKMLIKEKNTIKEYCENCNNQNFNEEVSCLNYSQDFKCKNFKTKL